MMDRIDEQNIAMSVVYDTKIKSTQSKKIKKANECADDFNVSR